MTSLQKNMLSVIIIFILAQQFVYGKPFTIPRSFLVKRCCSIERKSFASRMARIANSKVKHSRFLHQTPFYRQKIRQKFCKLKTTRDDLCHHDVCQQRYVKQDAIIDEGQKKTIQSIWVAAGCRRH